jgi:hypothetical protein
MRLWTFALVMLAVAIDGHAAEMDLSRCEFPEVPVVPDGATASEAELGEAGANVRKFVADGQTALDCLHQVETAMGPEITDEQRSTIVARYNASVDQLNAVAQRYNEEVRAYRAR